MIDDTRNPQPEIEDPKPQADGDARPRTDDLDETEPSRIAGPRAEGAEEEDAAVPEAGPRDSRSGGEDLDTLPR